MGFATQLNHRDAKAQRKAESIRTIPRLKFSSRCLCASVVQLRCKAFPMVESGLLSTCESRLSIPTGREIICRLFFECARVLRYYLLIHALGEVL